MGKYYHQNYDENQTHLKKIDILCQLVGASELNLRSAKLDFCKLLTGTLQTSFAVVVQIYFSIRTASPRENLLKE